MSPRPQRYKEWLSVVTQKMPHLSKPQAIGLTMWSFGIAITQSCGLSTVSGFLAELFEQPRNTLRQRLRDWYKDAADKQGKHPGTKRNTLEVSASFVPLLQWILSWWPAADNRLVLAADASTLGQRFTILLIAVVYRGCGIPVAWKIVGATEKGSWQPHWLSLFEHLKSGIPPDWFVLVTTDRGLYAKWLYDAIQALDWHPFMRINDQGTYQIAGQTAFYPLKGILSQVGESWSASVSCFKTNPIEGTLLARWDEGYRDPWLILTDLDANEADIIWYGLRSWIECLFKDIKRGGLKWHLTRMDDPQRAERLWLAIAVATIWLVSVGGQMEAQQDASSLNNRPQPSHPPEPDGIAPPSQQDSNRAPTAPQTDELQSQSSRPSRHLSCFRQGFLGILAAVFKGDALPIGQFVPDFWGQSEGIPGFSSG
ncbi:MAG: transposase [Symploca sp. SIO3C6]|nr:transposase [Symploca sp. SIO3C6]